MSDVQNAAPVQGQAAPAPASAGQAMQAQAPFYSYKGPDGKEEAFSSKEELDKAFKDSYFRTQDYTKKTQTLAEFRKQVEKEREGFAKQREDLERKAREYTDFDWLVKSRPDVYKQLQKLGSQPANPEVFYEQSKSYADEQSQAVKKELEELRQQMEEDRLQRQRVEIMNRMRTQYPDYPDDESVNATLEKLGSGNLEDVLEFIYHAHKGRSNPLEAEKRMAGAQKNKEGVKLMPSSGSAPDGKQSFRNLDEAADSYLKGISGG